MIKYWGTSGLVQKDELQADRSRTFMTHDPHLILWWNLSPTMCLDSKVQGTAWIWCKKHHFPSQKRWDKQTSPPTEAPGRNKMSPLDSKGWGEAGKVRENRIQASRNHAFAKVVSSASNTLPKNETWNLEPKKNEGLEDSFPFQTGDFQLPAVRLFPEGTSQSHPPMPSWRQLELPSLTAITSREIFSHAMPPYATKKTYMTPILTQFFQLVNRSPCVFPSVLKSSRIYSNDGDILPFFAALKENHITGWVPHADFWVPFPPHRDVGRPGGTQLEQNVYQRKKKKRFWKDACPP